MLKNLISRIITFSHDLTRRHLEWIFRVTSNSPYKVIAVSMLFVSLFSMLVATTRFEADIFKLFPSRLPALKLLLDSLDWTGSAKEAYFLLEGTPAKLPVEAQKLVTRLQNLQINGQPAFNRVTWRIYDESEGRRLADFIAYAVEHPQVYMNPADAPELVKRLSPTSFVSSLQRMESDLAGQFGSAMTGLVTSDPLYLREFILPRLKIASQALDLDTDSPFILSRDGQVMIIIAEPARPVQDVVFARLLVEGINKARSGLEVSVSCAGAHISAVLDEAAMKSNILSCILSSLVVVLAIFYGVYRRLLPTLLLPLIIIVGVVAALGTASLLLPSIHIISFAFMALIVGLGTDYSIHLYDRYHSERFNGRDVRKSLHLAVVDTGHGLFTAASTTALPFLALMVSDVRALYELGLLVGLGVLFSLYATLFFLPPLLIFMEKRFPSSFHRMPGLGMHGVWRAAHRHPRWILGFSLLLIVLCSGAAFWLTFDGELKNLQPRHSEAFLAQEKIEKHLSLAPRQMLIAVEGTDLGDVLERTNRVGILAERYQSGGQITAWSSLGRIINDRKDQNAIIQQMKSAAADRSLGDELEVVLEQRGFELEPFRPFIAALDAFGVTLPVPESEAIARLKASPLAAVVNRHLVQDGAINHSLVFLHYHGQEFDRKAFLDELILIDPTVRFTSVELVSSQLADSVSRSFMWSFLLGGLIVLFLFISHFRSKLGVFSSFFPVATGAVCMLGSMALFGMGLNFMNAMVLVTIVGMGSDYGLHLFHRAGESNDPAAEANFVQAGRAVLISALTTIAGFGSLAFADYPALASIGWATNLGVGFTAFFALVTLPAIMVIMANRKCKT